MRADRIYDVKFCSLLQVWIIKKHEILNFEASLSFYTWEWNMSIGMRLLYYTIFMIWYENQWYGNETLLQKSYSHWWWDWCITWKDQNDSSEVWQSSNKKIFYRSETWKRSITSNKLTLDWSFIMVVYSTNWFSSAVIRSLHFTDCCSEVSRTESLAFRSECNFSIFLVLLVSCQRLCKMISKRPSILLNGWMVC